jgi:BCD family chlorophyll transporter-like MFS transporter
LQAAQADTPTFRSAWRAFIGLPRARRLLWAVGLGGAAFSMQDVLLEPYGGQILHLSVGSTSALTAVMAGGALAAFALAANRLQRGSDPVRLAALGALIGVLAFAAVIFAEPVGVPLVFWGGAVLIGLGGGLFSVATLTEAMSLDVTAAESIGLDHGIALGAWGAVQATSTGVAIAVGGGLRDVVSALATAGWFGDTLATPATGYTVVYHIEVALLFATLVALGPLVRRASSAQRTAPPFGLAEFPG